MTTDPTQAREALAEIERTQGRTKTFRGYHHAGPFFLLWGVILFFANGANQFLDLSVQPIVWAVVGLGGMAASIVLGMRTRHQSRPDWRIVATFVAIFTFVYCAMIVLHPITSMQVNAFITLLGALIYVAAGIWLGMRYLITGLVVAALALYAFFNMADYFDLFMAVAYGGALVLTGLWLRKA